MLKLMKYEIIGKYKAFLILILAEILLNVLLAVNIWDWPAGGSLALSVLIASAAWIVLLVWSIGIFSKDLYEEKGYLTYTLPQKGYAIVTSKLIVAFIYFIIVAVIAGLFIRYFACRVNEITELMDYAGIQVNTLGMAIGGSLWYGFSFVVLLITIYFCIAVTRIAIAKRRMGKFIAFIVFVIIMIAEGFFAYFIEKLFPQNLYIKIFTGAAGSISESNINNKETLDLIANGIPVNISSLVITVVLFVIFYVATSYIVEKKIDL